ncbi:MAG: restriction endonuclease subunit S, partial [Bacteroidales bacterium]|nr:restriction endonuclease subunit S [Bacteroidales bacterium]
QYISEGYPLITSKDFCGNGFDFSKTKYISREDYLKISERSKVDIGDILYSMIGGNIGNHVIITKENYFDMAIKNVALFKQYNYSLIDNKFIAYYLQYITKQLQSNASGGAQPFVALKVFRNLELPLPPLAEQKRIVAKIEELLPLVEEYGNAQEELNKLNATLPDKLRQSILQEAIMGKLVPQDPNDEPASKLLEKIREEKMRLVKEGKLKKSILKIASLKDCEYPFELPSSWTWCKLGEIGEWGAGATPAKGHPEFYSNGVIPWLRTGELNNGFVYDSEIKVSEEALKKCSLRMNSVGDVLIAMYGATIGKVAIAGIPLTTNQACCACTPILIYNKYLLYYLMASKQAFIELGEGGAQPNISREKIVEFPLALPPLAEQKRIVAKLEELLPKLNELK